VAEVLDRVLDRGIVIDAWVRVSVIGLTLMDVDARLVVASIQTYLLHGEGVAGAAVASRPGPAREPAPAPDRPAAPRRRRRRAARVMLACAQGCTFMRAPADTLRCPVDHRVCEVSPV
jgi:hypothetical protein